MAEFLFLKDDAGNLTRVVRIENQTAQEQLQNTIGDYLQASRGLPFGTGSNPSPDTMVRQQPFNVFPQIPYSIFEFQDIRKSIADTPNFTDLQRAEANALFDTATPGDRLNTGLDTPALPRDLTLPGVTIVGTTKPLFSTRVSDSPPPVIPLIPVFVDP